MEGDCDGYYVSAKRFEFDSILEDNLFRMDWMGYISEGISGFGLDYLAYQDIYIRPGQKVRVSYQNCVNALNFFPPELITPYVLTGACDTIEFCSTTSQYYQCIFFTVSENTQIEVALLNADHNNLKEYVLLNVIVVPETIVQDITQQIENTSFITQIGNLLQFYFPDDKEYQIDLVNSFGQRIKSFSASDKSTLDLTEFSQGVYFVKTNSPNLNEFGKVIRF